MSTKAGQLLWSRQHITLLASQTLNVDTGLTQLNTGFDNSSLDEPGFGTPSRVHVIPMAPVDQWSAVTHDEPTIGPNGTIVVTFRNQNLFSVEINVLFWDPHTAVGPGDADSYIID